MWKELEKCIHLLDKDDDIRIIVIRGADNQPFSAGADIDEFKTTRDTVENTRAYRDIINSALMSVENTGKPVIAVINGYALGGGCEMALSADFRIASENARLGVTAARLGAVTSFHNARRLVRTVGASTAKVMLLFARSLTAKEALDKGLVDYVLPEEKIDEFVSDLVNDINQMSSFSVKAFKEMINAAQNGIDKGGKGEEIFDRYTTGYALSPHFQERVKAFSKKERDN